MALLFLLSIYMLGGLTFFPLIFLGLLLHAYLTLPVKVPHGQTDGRVDTKSLPSKTSSGSYNSKIGSLGRGSTENRPHGAHVAAAYFAVTREFVSGALSGKSLERSISSGVSTTSESPSVYASMYRSVFERAKPLIPSMEMEKDGVRSTRRTLNVFYIVLRYCNNSSIALDFLIFDPC